MNCVSPLRDFEAKIDRFQIKQNVLNLKSTLLSIIYYHLLFYFYFSDEEEQATIIDMQTIKDDIEEPEVTTVADDL